MVEDVELGGAIRRARESAGLTQPALAARMVGLGMEGATPFLISKVESGQRPCRATELVTFARALGVQPEGLLLAADKDALERAMEEAEAARDQTHAAATAFVMAVERALMAYDAEEPEYRVYRDRQKLLTAMVGSGKRAYVAVAPERIEEVRAALAEMLGAVEIVEYDDGA